MYVPTVWLAALGAAVASGWRGPDPPTSCSDVRGDGAAGAPADPARPIATNILNFYSCGLAALSLARWSRAGRSRSPPACSPRPCSSTFIEAGDFAKSFDAWMVSLIVWISPWAAILPVEFFVVHRGRVDVATLYEARRSAKYGDINWRALLALGAGLVAGWSWQFGLAPEFQGPVAKAFSNTDLSWLTGAVVAGRLYYLLCGRAAPTRSGRPAAVPICHVSYPALWAFAGLAARFRRGGRDLLRRRRREPGARRGPQVRLRTCSTMSHQAYGPRVGVPRILDAAATRLELPATFFFPGATAERGPARSTACSRPATRSPCTRTPPAAGRAQPRPSRRRTSTPAWRRCEPRRRPASATARRCGSRRRSRWGWSSAPGWSTTPR